MLASATKKIKSARRLLRSKPGFFQGLLLISGVFLIGFGSVLVLAPDKQADCAIRVDSDVDALKTGDCITLEIVSSPSARIQGLSDRQSLPLDRGMLFVFDEAGQNCLWMKDMNFAIDMVWLDASKKIVHIESQVSPDTYPESFCPQTPALYAIELNAGTGVAAGLRVGDSVWVEL